VAAFALGFQGEQETRLAAWPRAIAEPIKQHYGADDVVTRPQQLADVVFVHFEGARVAWRRAETDADAVDAQQVARIGADADPASAGCATETKFASE